ncbi:hypothetical protein BDP67DRAFT_80007 [Colletotrichum lupini]|nr:hypothetical protein BDP67DRAFT_80007 [Colletotrichum lupini]
MDIGGKSEHLQHAHLYTRHMWNGQSLLPPPQRADAGERVPRNTPDSDKDHGTERRKIVRRWKGTHSVINPNLEIAPENRGTQRPFMALRVTVCKITMVVVVVRCHFLCSVRQARKLFHDTLYALLSSTFRCRGWERQRTCFVQRWWGDFSAGRDPAKWCKRHRESLAFCYRRDGPGERHGSRQSGAGVARSVSFVGGDVLGWAWRRTEISRWGVESCGVTLTMGNPFHSRRKSFSVLVRRVIELV